MGRGIMASGSYRVLAMNDELAVYAERAYAATHNILSSAAAESDWHSLQLTEATTGRYSELGYRRLPAENAGGRGK